MYESITIKIGSNVLTDKKGLLHTDRIEHLVSQIAALHKQNKKLILVSSGAVAAGRQMVSLDKISDSVSSRQLLSSVGQVKLLNIYANLFDMDSFPVAAASPLPPPDPRWWVFRREKKNEMIEDQSETR